MVFVHLNNPDKFFRQEFTNRRKSYATNIFIKKQDSQHYALGRFFGKVFGNFFL